MWVHEERDKIQSGHQFVPRQENQCSSHQPVTEMQHGKILQL